MKRDMEVIRKMVLAIEDAPNGYAPDDLAIEGYAAEQISYHSYLLLDAGLANGTRVDNMDSNSPEAMLQTLTWAGHEFADAARDDTRWQKAMGIVKEKSGSVTMAVLTELLKNLMKGALGLP